MKLSEIIEPVSFNKQLKRPFDFDYIAKAEDRNRKRPSGFFSHVNKSKDPQMVIKSPNHASEKGFDLEKIDGFTHFAKWVMKTKINQSNPYFPRIYTKTKIQDSDGRYVTQYEMEKLIPHQSVHPELLLDYLTELLKPNQRGIYSLRTHRDASYDFAAILRDRVTSGNGGTKIFIDQSLIEACKWIRLHQGNFDLDLHSGNFMYRRTSFGVQLVFSDPYGSNLHTMDEIGKVTKDINKLKHQGY